MAGRPQSTKGHPKYLIRLRPDLQPALERCHGLLQRTYGPKTTQTEAFWYIIEAGCAALEQALGGTEPAAPRTISAISDIAGDDISVPGYGFPEDEDETPASPTNGAHAPAPAVKTPMTPTGMQPCPKGHAPYPLSQHECPACGRERLRLQRQPAPEAPAALRPRRALNKLTPSQEQTLRAKRQQGIPVKDLMEEYGVSKATVFRYAPSTDARTRRQPKRPATRKAGVR